MVCRMTEFVSILMLPASASDGGDGVWGEQKPIILPGGHSFPTPMRCKLARAARHSSLCQPNFTGMDWASMTLNPFFAGRASGVYLQHVHRLMRRGIAEIGSAGYQFLCAGVLFCPHPFHHNEQRPRLYQ